MIRHATYKCACVNYGGVAKGAVRPRQPDIYWFEFFAKVLYRVLLISLFFLLPNCLFCLNFSNHGRSILG